MRVSVVLRTEMWGCEAQGTYIEGVYRDNGKAYDLVGKLETKYPDDYIEAEEYEVLDDPS